MRQRLTVTDLIWKVHGFRSAQQIHATLQERGDNIGLATIYRPLALMANSRGVDVLAHEEPHYSSTSPTPSPHWRPIDRAIVNLDIPTDAGKELFPDLDVVKPYLHYTGSLQSEPVSQNRAGAQRSGSVSCLVPDEADVSVANEPGRRHRPLTVS